MERAARDLDLDDYSDAEDEDISSTSPGPSKTVRHDTPMESQGTYDDPIDLDELPDIMPSRAAVPKDEALLALHEPVMKRRKRKAQEVIDLEEQPKRHYIVPILNIKPLEDLPAPIGKTVPENLIKLEDGLSVAKARAFEIINSIAAEFKTQAGNKRPPDRRKNRIEAALPGFQEYVAALQPEDQMECIEQINVQVIHEHNKSTRVKKQHVKPVEYPGYVVKTVRETFTLVATPPEVIYQKAESVISWPIEFKCRLPFIRKQQLVDLANGYRKVHTTWSPKCLMEWRAIWRELCRIHNEKLGKTDEDRVDDQLCYMTEEEIAEAERKAETPGEESSSDDQTGSSREQTAEESDRRSGSEDTQPTTVLSDDKMEFDEDGHYYPQSPHLPEARFSPKICAFCNKDGQYRPRCPDVFVPCCEYCSKPCSCGVLPNEKVLGWK